MSTRLLKLTLSSLLFSFLTFSAFAAKSPVERQTTNPLINRSLQYAFPDEHNRAPTLEKVEPRHTLGRATPSASPGTVIGNTWFDSQHKGSMGRMITWGLHGYPDTLLVHFSWMYLPNPIFTSSEYYYKCWNALDGNYQCETGLQPDDEYAGYVGVDVTGNNRAVVGGHNNLSPPYDPSQSHFYWDYCPGCCTFDFSSRIPDSVSSYCQGYPGGTGTMWPKFRYVEGPNDTVLHIIAQETEPGIGDPRTIMYFRRVGSDRTPGAYWDYPPYCIDTMYNLAHDIAATSDGKVALVWTANLPCPGHCDTCSGYECWNFPQMDNDLYYQVSYDYGQTFQHRANVTKNVDGEEGYRPYTDLSALITSDGNLHIVWGARFWPADANQGGQAGLLSGRIFHWSENWPYILTVHNSGWDQTTCNGGAWQLSASKMTISECNGRLYVLFVQFNDPEIMMDDCADESNPGFPSGASNGDLYLCISEDQGLTWDKARNLTNSHTPGCDSVGGVGGPCDNDHWPSMTRFGTDYPGDFSQATIVVPEGSTDPGTFYLDVQYINDHSAGAIIESEGFWAEADVRWFRLPCVGPKGEPRPIIIPREIAYPAWTQHGVEKDTFIIIENRGNEQFDYSVAIQECTGPSGWLDLSSFSGSVPPGLNNRDTITLILNKDGLVNDPGTTVNLVGRLIFTWDCAALPDTFPISFFVTDDLIPVQWDTIRTSCLALTVDNTGNFGRQGLGRVNMDYHDSYGDSAEIYLYDGSPVVGYTRDDDTIVNFSIFSTSYLDQNGFVPIGEPTPTTDSGDCEIFRSGKFVTHDSLIAVEKVWYAPADPSGDTCSFVIERIMVYLNDDYVGDTTITDVRIGEAIDWDIPADTNVRNYSGFEANLDLIFQQGCEEDGQAPYNNRRFGGIRFLDGYNNDVQYEPAQPHGVYTHDNSSHVYPFSGFAPETLYTYMGNSGYELSDSCCSDLYTLMTFDSSLTLTPADTYLFSVVIISQYDGDLKDFFDNVYTATQWYCGHINPQSLSCGCCRIRGDVNHDGTINIADLTYKVNWLFREGPPPPCPEEVDDNGDGDVDIADLTYEVDYLFKGGPPPVPCP